MNNPKRGFVVYFDNYPMLLALPPEQRGLLFTALMQYADGRWRGEVSDPEEVLERWPGMEPQARMGFRFMASAVDRDTQRWLLRRQSGERRRQQTQKEGERSAPAPGQSRAPCPDGAARPPVQRGSGADPPSGGAHPRRGRLSLREQEKRTGMNFHTGPLVQVGL